MRSARSESMRPPAAALALAHAAREALGVEQYPAYVLETGDYVEAGQGVLPHGRVVAELLVGVVRAVLEAGIQEVDLLRRFRLHRRVGFFRGHPWSSRILGSGKLQVASPTSYSQFMQQVSIFVRKGRRYKCGRLRES